MLLTTLAPHPRRTLLAMPLALTLAACGGGGDSADPVVPTPPPVTPLLVLTGVAATGAPIQGTVVAIDVNGKLSPPAVTSSTTGAYTVDVTGLTAPYLLTVNGSAGGRQVVLTSVATAAGQTVNLTPLTDLIVATAAGVNAGSSLVEACTPSGASVAAACLSALNAATAGSKLADATALVARMIAPLNSAGTDPLNGSFKADGTGLDGVLDRLLVAPDSNGQATVTLVSTQTVIGQANGPGSLSVTPPTADQAQAADAAAQVLPEINACLASMAALYPSAGFTAPTAAQVGAFIDPDFFGFGVGRDELVGFLSSGEAPAIGGFSPKALSLARRDLSPLSGAEIAVLADAGISSKVSTILNARPLGGAPVQRGGAGAPQRAWVNLSVFGGSAEAQQFTKGAAYAGCSSGWRWAGNRHLDMHMAARLTRDESLSGAAALGRERAFHIERDAVALQVQAGSPDVDTVDVHGPGIVAYSGNPATPVGASTTLTLKRSADPFVSAFVIGDGTGFYRNGEALRSCSDLAAQSGAPAAGTPCIDEALVNPGSIYIWALKAAGSGQVVAAFPYEINAVPLSKVFALANANDLFASITSVAPGSVAAVNAAIAGASAAVLEGVFSINTTQGKAYGATPDNCRFNLFDSAGNAVLVAEANAVGSDNRCTFTTDGLNSGSLAKPTRTVGSASVSVATTALGNQITTLRRLP